MKRKLKRIFIAVLWVLMVAASLTGLTFANRWQEQAICRAVLIKIHGVQGYPLISEKEISNIVSQRWGKPVGKPLKYLVFRDLEDDLRRIPVIESAEVFASLSGITEIHVTQRKPLMKLFFKEGNTFYLDGFGYFFKVNPGYSDRVLTVSGQIPFRITNFKRINDIPENNPAYKSVLDLFQAGKYIQSHRLLNSLIAQVFYNNNGDVELIPVTGDHTILLGDFSDLEWRLDNLLLFYLRTAGRIDYRRYPVVNLKFKNQIVLTQNIP